MDDERANKVIKVYRSPDEVFSAAAMSSFECKPVTDEHPNDWVNPDNISIYGKGVAQNIRRSREEPDLLVGDLMIYDGNLIKEIQEGKREVSCGYDCLYEDNGNGILQKQICGNHVAVVHAGRAGDRVAIKDNSIKEGDKKMASKFGSLEKPKTWTERLLFATGLKTLAADAEPAQLMDALEAMEKEKEENEKMGKEPEKKESKDEGEENPALAALTEKVDKLTGIVEKMLTKGSEEKKPEDMLDAAIAELETPQEELHEDEIAEMCAKICAEMAAGGEIAQEQIAAICTQVCMQVAAQMGSMGELVTDENSEESVTVDPEMITDEEGPVSSESDRPKNPLPNADNAYKVQALRAMKPVIAAITDPVAKKKACDALMASIKRPAQRKKTYSSIAKGQKSYVQKKQNKDSQPKDYSKLGKDIAKQFNPHYKESK